MTLPLGKDTVLIGSAAGCELHLPLPGVAPQHARVRRLPDGQLVLEDLGAGQTLVNGTPLPPGGSAAFDFRNQFVLGQGSLPPLHPVFIAMLLQRGSLPAPTGAVVVGRDPNHCHLVILHPSVSGKHCTLQSSPLSVIDHQSTSGVWLSGRRLEPGTPVAITPQDILAIGPVPLPIGVVAEVFPPSGPAAAAPEAAEGGAPRKKHKTVIGQVSLGSATAGTKTIGRTPNNDIVLPHAQVSSRHALLHSDGGQLYLEDLGSSNGTYVRGKRLTPNTREPVANGEKVFIGPMPLLIQVEGQQVAMVVEDRAEWSGRPLYEIEAWDLVMEVQDRDDRTKTKLLLDHVSFKALPGDLIALMGPSGAGKTTLLLTLNGYLPPTAGQVRINGEDLYAIYDALRGSIGYVPQDDIVHPELTVWEAVRYSARMRLPPDYSDEEIDRRVETTLAQLGLDAVRHLQIGKPEKKVLSGGQRKRVNIAMELVTDPVIMFLDEPTSGLAADDTTALVSLLSELARKTGKTIITTIHQPAKDEFEKFNLALILGAGGLPIFYGSPQDGYGFFGTILERQGKRNNVDNPRDMFDMLNQREQPILQALRAQNPAASREQARRTAAREWNQEFFHQGNPVFQKMYTGARTVGAGSQLGGVPHGPPRTTGQFSLLFGRYLRTKLRDVSGTVIMLAQAPIIGVLLALVFGGQKETIPFWCLGALQQLSKRGGGDLGSGVADTLAKMTPTTDHSAALFFLVVAAVWFGTSNSAREIVAERAIYRRERMVNLKLGNYVLSKFLLLSLICVVQCTILLGVVFFALGFHGGPAAFAQQLAVLTLTAMNSVALGLLVSTMVTSSEAAMSLTPIALIPQVVLGGLMVPMTTNSLLQWPMYLMPSRWGFQGTVVPERMSIAADAAWIIDLKRPDLTSGPDFITSGNFQCAVAQMSSEDLVGAWGFSNYELTWLPPVVLVGMMVVMIGSILILLKQRDSI